MNINILDNSSDVSDYLNIMTSYNFMSYVDNNYTRVTDVSKSVTDHYSLAISIYNNNIIKNRNRC